MLPNPSLLLALDYLVLLAELKPEKAKLAAIRWHGRLELDIGDILAGRVAVGTLSARGSVRRQSSLGVGGGATSSKGAADADSWLRLNGCYGP